MLVLGRDQYYCISVCEEKHSLLLTFILREGGNHSADQRMELFWYFKDKLEMLMKDFMNASTKPKVYIPCCLCNEPHVEFLQLLEGEQQHCPTVQKPLPDEHYHDLITNKGICVLTNV